MMADNQHHGILLLAQGFSGVRYRSAFATSEVPDPGHRAEKSADCSGKAHLKAPALAPCHSRVTVSELFPLRLKRGGLSIPHKSVKQPAP